MGDRSLKLGDLKEVAKRELVAILDKISVSGDKRKGILVDPALIDPLKHSGISTEAFTNEKGVEFLHPLDERAEVDPKAVRAIVIFVRPNLDLMRTVASTIERYLGSDSGSGLKFWVLFAPRKTLICQHMLETEFKLGQRLGARLEIDEFELDWVPLDDDLLSMELPHGGAFRDIFLEGDTTSLHYVARAFVKLQTLLIGRIPRVYAKGNLASKCVQFLRRMTAEAGDLVSELPSQVESLFVLDRGVDLATPLLTQLTYEGLVDEVFGPLRTQTVTFPAGLDVPGLKPDEARNGLHLNADDRVFDEIRDLNFSQVGYTLNQRAIDVKKQYDRRKEMQQLKEIRDFMKTLPQMQETHRLVGVHAAIAGALGKHTATPAFRKHIAMEHSILQGTDEREVCDYIDDMINKGEPMRKVLQMLSLMSVTSQGGGLKPRVYDQFRESMQLSYGIPQTMAALFNLERAGLLTRASGGFLGGGAALPSLGNLAAAGGAAAAGKADFTRLRRACRLWVEGLDEKDPKDVAYAYAGYAPLLLRTVEAMIDPDKFGGGREKVLDLIPGDAETMTNEAEVTGSARISIVFVLGGVTHAEVNAIRKVLAMHEDALGQKRHFVVATTGMLSGARLVGSMLPFDA